MRESERGERVTCAEGVGHRGAGCSRTEEPNARNRQPVMICSTLAQPACDVLPAEVGDRHTSTEIAVVRAYVLGEPCVGGEIRERCAGVMALNALMNPITACRASALRDSREADDDPAAIPTATEATAKAATAT
jgi:hypothetical protein